MDQQRRLLTFITLSMAILLLWNSVVMPIIAPIPPAPKLKPEDLALEFERPVDALQPENVLPEAVAAPKPAGLPDHPRRDGIVLGSLDPQSRYFLKVELSSLGAAIQSIQLNDPRYPEIGQRDTPLTLVGHDAASPAKTFAANFPQVEAQLGGKTLEDVDWEVVPGSESPSAVQFRIVSADGTLEITKRYELEQLSAGKQPDPETRDNWAQGYHVKLTIAVRNLAAEAQQVSYDLRGPVGLPLEDPENSAKHRDVRMGFLDPDGGVDASQFGPAQAVKNEKNNNVEVWKRPIQYIGVDTQYFAALVHPLQDQLTQPTIEYSRAEVIKEGPKPEFADLSVTLSSLTRTLGPRDDLDSNTLTDEYVLFAGPKRPALLESIQAEPVLDYGWFGAIVVVMLWLLDFLHSVGLNYGLAIVGLTCVVRLLIFPLSRYQSRSMDKMKELQPKIKSLHEKYKKNPESLSREEMRTMQEVNLKMMMGCLPLLAQMPIFFALYRALQMSVDLRMAPMHIFGNWIDNLAAPDNLFGFGFNLPLLGWNAFNLLPVITIVLFVVNQKITMPPPADEEQALQYKMMNVMMIVMGVFFWRVPAGLCVYFIVSSIWGVTERMLLKRFAAAKAAEKPGDAAQGALLPEPGPKPVPAPAAAKPGYFDDLKNKLRDLQQMADKPAAASRDKDRKRKSR